MRYLRHDSGGEKTAKNTQVLGEESPLEFDDDGQAGPMADELAKTVAAMDAHIAVGERVRDHSAADDGGAAHEDDVDEDNAFDAAAFVNRTPMANVVKDIESGSVDAHLEEVAAAEAEGRDRKGVADAITDRREG
jgi:hypothetical protein